MKPYALKNFSERFVKDTNIQDVGSYVWTPYLNIKSEYRDDFEIYDDEEYASVSIPYIEKDELLDDPLNYEWCMGSDFDHWEYYDFISQLIKTTNHYLCPFIGKVIVFDYGKRKYISNYWRYPYGANQPFMVESEREHFCEIRRI